jgi:hypothetical protein
MSSLNKIDSPKDCVPGPRNACGHWIIDQDATLLPPDDPRGVEVYTLVGYKQQYNKSIVKDPTINGLKSIRHIRTELDKNYESKRNAKQKLFNEFNKKHEDTIFFRPPYHPPKGASTRFEDIYPIFQREDYKEFSSRDEYEKYIDSLKINDREKEYWKKKGQIITIKVDPDKTYTYWDDYRVSWDDPKKGREKYDSCRIKLIDFLEAKDGDSRICSGSLEQEILIRTPVIGPEWFVKKNFYIVPKVKQNNVIKINVSASRSKRIKQANSLDKYLKKTNTIQTKLGEARAKLSKLPTKGTVRTQAKIDKERADLAMEIELLEKQLATIKGGRNKTRKHSKK